MFVLVAVLVHARDYSPCRLTDRAAAATFLRVSPMLWIAPTCLLRLAHAAGLRQPGPVIAVDPAGCKVRLTPPDDRLP